MIYCIFQVSTLCHLTDNSFQSSQVLKLEIHVLKALNFDLTIADPTTFLDRYLEIETNQDREVRTSSCSCEVKYMVCWYIVKPAFTVTCYKQPVNFPTSLTWSSKVYPTWSIYMYLMVGFHSRLEKFSVIHFRDVPNTLLFSLITIFMGFLFRRIRSYCL